LAQIDVRAGSDRGRIYRVLPTGKKAWPVPDLTQRSGAGLAKAIESPNGTLRELAHQQIVWSADKAAVPGLRRLVRTGSQPQIRVQAMAALAQLGRLAKRDVVSALDDTHPAVRRHAIRLGEGLAAGDPDWIERLAKRADDPDPFVRQQLAHSLGQATQPKAGKTLAKLLLRDAADPYLAAAILSSSLPHMAAIQKTALDSVSIPKAVTKQIEQIATRAGAKLATIAEAAPANPQPTAAPSRDDALKQFAKASALKGSAAAGRAIFQARCSACHKLGGIGNPVGPDLAALTDKSPGGLLIGTLDPNREVSEQYATFLVRLKSGITLAGMIADETANGFTLRGVDGKPQTILRADIAELKAAGRSLMPEGLESGLSLDEMANLLAFIANSN
jgi:putative heme-binding domain-containing protein